MSDASGKVVFKGTTNTNGSFTTGNLRAGDYIVQFTSNNAVVKANRYAVVVSAGTAKMSAKAIAGERFAGAGVAMKITVGISISDTLKQHQGLNNPAAIRVMERENREANLNITGQLTAEH